MRIEIETISEAGIRVTPVRDGPRPTFRFDTETNAQAQAVWSYVEAEKCFIGRSPSYAREDRKTWYPTGYLYRLLHDEDRRAMVGIGLSLFLLPVMLSVGISVMRALNPPSVTEDSLATFSLAGLAVSAAMMLLLVVWMFSNKEFGMEGLPLKFALGVAFGVVWIITLGGTVTPALLAGAAWTFAGSNLLWGMTAGMDHWGLDYEFQRVGGRLLRDEARKRLQELRDARRSQPD